MESSKPWWDQPNHPVYIIILVVLLVFSGWFVWWGFLRDDDDSGRRAGSSSEQGSTRSPGVAPTPTETPPVLPDTAKEKTLDGVKAFVAYYFDALNYTQRTNDVSALRAIQLEERCEGCQFQINFYENLEEEKEKIFGGKYRAQSSVATPVDDDTYACLADFTREDSSLVNSTGKTTETRDGSEAGGQLQLRVLWNENRWQITEQTYRLTDGS
ncbi:MAG: DUF6318 family protein [Mycobacteriales bacterium]